MEKPKKLKSKAKLLWRLVTTTPGVGDLADPLKRVERSFDALTRNQQTTVAMIALNFERGMYEIETAPEVKASAPEIETTPEVKEVIPPSEVEILPPGATREEG